MMVIWLVVGSMAFMIFHILGIIIPTDFHIFQRGWNCQPVHNGKSYSNWWFNTLVKPTRMKTLLDSKNLVWRECEIQRLLSREMWEISHTMPKSHSSIRIINRTQLWPAIEQSPREDGEWNPLNQVPKFKFLIQEGTHLIQGYPHFRKPPYETLGLSCNNWMFTIYHHLLSGGELAPSHNRSTLRFIQHVSLSWFAYKTHWTSIFWGWTVEHHQI